MVEVFKRNKFMNPHRQASKWLNVHVSIHVCPELEIMLDLQAQRPKPPRRLSVMEARGNKTALQRRNTIDVCPIESGICVFNLNIVEYIPYNSLTIEYFNKYSCIFNNF